MNYQEASQYLLSLAEKEARRGQVVMSRQAMVNILERLGNPHLGRHSVHIGGTKGKGSTSSYVSSIISAAGFSTALYTSPHLHFFTERVCFDLEQCPEDQFVQALMQVYDTVEEETAGQYGPVSTFGALTALFFWLARQRGVDWQIIEVGLGGIDDATNVLEHTDVIALTAISLEHTDILGNTTVEIATKKAGIIKPGATVVAAQQSDPAVVDVFAARCREVGADFVDVSKVYEIGTIKKSEGGQIFEVESNGHKREFALSMLGHHQIANAVSAIAVADALVQRGHKISPEALHSGLERVAVPGRFEMLPGEPRTIIDGAHNGESMQALLDTLKDYVGFENLVLILGVNADKKIDDIIAALAGHKVTLIASRSHLYKALPPEQIMEAAQAQGITSYLTHSLQEALDKARDCCGKNDLICVTGSLYLVGDAREIALGQDNWSLLKNKSALKR